MAGEATILHVEDHRPTAETARETLSDAGFRVLSAYSLAQAREALSRHHIDLAILDVHLPDGNGLDLLEELQKPDAPPALIVSSDDRAAIHDRALASGGGGFLRKPHHPDHLSRAVRRLLDKSATPA